MYSYLAYGALKERFCGIFMVSGGVVKRCVVVCAVLWGVWRGALGGAVCKVLDLLERKIEEKAKRVGKE